MEKFSFIIHPIDVKRDAARKYPVLKYASESVIEKLMLKLTPKVTSHVTGVQSITGAQAEGWLVQLPLSPRQFQELPTEFVYEKIAQAGRAGAEQGAGIVGLGAFTSVVGDAGITVAEKLRGVINVTSGNSYTVFTAVEGLLRAAEIMEVDVASARCAVIGASGSTGAVCAKMMAEICADVVLVGRDESKLTTLKADIEARASTRSSVWTTSDINQALRESDLILAVSASTDALIYPQDLKAGAIICDVARPRDVSRQVVEERDDVLVIEGGVISVPGDVNFNFNFGFPDKTAYACMSETMLMALEGTYEPFTLGRDLSVEQVQRIGAIAKKHGFKLAGFRSFEKAVDEAAILRVRDNARKKHAPQIAVS